MAGLGRRTAQAFGLDYAQMRVLLALRLKLIARQFMRQPGQVGGILLLLVTVGPLALFFAVMSAVGYRRSPGEWPVNILAFVLVALWVVWIMLPMLAFRTNEGLDLERLLIYPVRARELVATTLIGTLLDWPTYFTLPFFVAILIGWFDSPALPVVLLAALLGYLHMITASQLTVSATTGLLRSRRFRDVVIVAISLLGSSCYFVAQGAKALAQALGVDTLRMLQPMIFLQWLPPGAAARAVQLVLDGDWLSAMLWLLYSVAWLAAGLWAWWTVLRRVTTGVAVWQPRLEPAPRKIHRASAGNGNAPTFLHWIDPRTRMMLSKEVRAMWRVPQRRISAVQSVISPLILIFFLGMNGTGRTTTAWTSTILPGLALFAAWSNSMNMLGMEGRGLPTLLLTPAPRHHLFAGKGLAIWLLTTVPLTLFALIVAVIQRNPAALIGWLAMLGVALAGVSINMFAAIYLAWPFDEEKTSRQNTGGGCAAALGQVVIVPMAMGIAAVPILLPLGLGVLLNLWWLQLGAALFSIPYGAIVFAVAATQAGKRLPWREAEVLEATRWRGPR